MIKNAGTELHGDGESLARGAGSLAPDSAPQSTPSCQTRTFSPGVLVLPSHVLELSSPCSKPSLHKRPHSISAFFRRKTSATQGYPVCLTFFLSIFVSLSKAHEYNALIKLRTNLCLLKLFSLPENFCCT